VIDYPDGRLSIQYEGRELSYKMFDKLPKVNQAAIVENKRSPPAMPARASCATRGEGRHLAPAERLSGIHSSTIRAA